MNEMSELIGDLYEAVLAPNNWHSTMERIAESSNADGMLGLIFDPTEAMVIQLASINVTDEVFPSYETYYAAVCPRMAYVAQHPEYSVIYDYPHSNERAIDRSEFCEWFGRYSSCYYIAIQLFGDSSIAGG